MARAKKWLLSQTAHRQTFQVLLGGRLIIAPIVLLLGALAFSTSQASAQSCPVGSGNPCDSNACSSTTCPGYDVCTCNPSDPSCNQCDDVCNPSCPNYNLCTCTHDDDPSCRTCITDPLGPGCGCSDVCNTSCSNYDFCTCVHNDDPSCCTDVCNSSCPNYNPSDPSCCSDACNASC